MLKTLGETKNNGILSGLHIAEEKDLRGRTHDNRNIQSQKAKGKREWGKPKLLGYHVIQELHGYYQRYNTCKIRYQKKVAEAMFEAKIVQNYPKFIK